MRTRIRGVMLWLWPRIRRIYSRYGLELSLRDMQSAPGAHTTTAAAKFVSGAHVWVLAALALGSILFLTPAGKAQQGAQTSSTPPLTGSVAPAGNCGIGSMYVNTTTGDLYDCSAGSWLKVNGGGSGAFSGGLGASFQDATEIAAPANPAAGNDRLWLDSTTHLLACHTAAGGNCMPSGGAGTVTQVTSGNFSPLFNVSVATNTTTPAFSFAGISQTQNLFFASPNGSSGNPGFRALAAADFPTSANNCATHQFTISLASGFNVTCAQPLAADIGSLPGSSGQLLFNNAGAIGAEDPIVSYAYVNLLNAAAATATQTSATTRVSTFSGYGTLYVTLASLSGTYTSCTVQLKNADSLGNLINNGSAIALTMSNGVATFGVTSAAGLQTAAQIQAVYSCSAYGSAGTISVDYVPGISVGLVGPLPAGTNDVGKTDQGTAAALSGAWPVQVTDKTNTMPTMDAAGRAGFVKVTDGTNTHPTGDAAARKIFVQPTDGANNLSYADPCLNGSHTPVSINQTAKTKLVSGVSAKKIYVCSIHVVTATAQNVALIEGTGTTCGTGPSGVVGFGGSAAASGWNFAANGGIAMAGGGYSLGQEGTAADDLCLDQSGTGQVSGGLVYVQQ